MAITHLPRPFLPGFLTPFMNSKYTCLSLQMVGAGWGVTYELSGAEYGQWGKKEFLRMEEEARYVCISSFGFWS